MEDGYQNSRPPQKGMSSIVLVVAVVAFVGLSFFGVLAYLKHNNNASQANTGHNSVGGGNSSGQSYYLGSGSNMPSSPPSGGSSSCNGQPTLMLDIGGQQVQTCGQPAQGKTSAVSSSSITVQPSSGSAKTFSIMSSTKIIKHDHSAGTTADINVGDPVVVIPGSSGSSQAGYILINPNLGTQGQ